MENTSNDEVVQSKSSLFNISNSNTDNNFAFKEKSNSIMDATLNYLTKILMEEEEISERDIEYQDNPDLWAVEKHFYSILGQEHPLPLNNLSLSDKSEANPICCTYSSLQNQFNSSSRNVFVSSFNQSRAQERYVISSTDNMEGNSQPNKNIFPSMHKNSVDFVEANSDNDEDNKNKLFAISGSRGKKKFNEQDLDLIEQRNCKISAPFVEETARDPTFDEVLLYDDFYTKDVASLKEIMQTKLKNKKKPQTDVPNLRDLLISCSNLVAADDRKTAEALIKEIKMYSSPDGDGKQRVACMLVDALEARLTASGYESYNKIVAERISTADSLRAHQLFMTVSPYTGMSFYVTNQTILKAVDKASKLHIIDFGINYGFQYPSLIQILSNQKRKTIKLRITGIELPQPGFRPAKLVEETGRRLEEYAKMFDVPFEYNSIVSHWENLWVNDFKIEADEVLIVNSMYRFRQLGDERTGLDCPRDQVLKLIHNLRPDIFIFGIYNAALSPFFITRFKQAMAVYEKYFDLLDTFIPRDNRIRKIMERDVARNAINVIACEGTSWIERTETYKTWHQRALRAGFEQIPLDPTVVKKCIDTLRKFYDKGFILEEESNWFLQGWRGRILYGLSTWKPKA